MNSTPKTSNLFHSKLTARAFAALAPALISLTLPYMAQAATRTWDGEHGTVSHWFAGINWSDNTAPVDGDDLVFTGTTRLNHLSWADLGGADNDFDIGSITFDENAGAFVINNGGGPAGSIIKLQGDITNNSTNLQTINFHFQLNGGNRTVNTSAGDIAIGGIISQDGSSRRLYKTGSGTLTLSNANNSYAGGTSIGYQPTGTAGGTLAVTHSNAVGTGNIQFEQGGTLELGNNGLNLSNFVYVPNWGGGTRTIRLDRAGTNTATLTGNMDIRFGTGNGFVADVGEDDTLTFAGNISTGAGGGAGITKAGAGILVLEGTNTYKGPTTVNNGTLIVDGDSSGVAGNVTIASGATLGGSGTIGGATTIQSGATLAAGNSPGVLTFNDDLTLSAGSDTVMEITGTTRGSQYDGIDVGGLLTYGGDLTITSDTEIADGTYDLFGINGTEGGDFASVVLSGLAYSDDAFTLSSDVWTATVGSKTYTFSQITGDLTVVPEPETFALLGGLLALGYVMLRRRR